MDQFQFERSNVAHILSHHGTQATEAKTAEVTHQSRHQVRVLQDFYARNLRVLTISYSICPWKTSPA